MTSYVEPRSSRHREEFVDGVQQLRIPFRRQWFLFAFLPIWLAGWTAGGVAAIHQVVQHFEPFLIVWLAAWAVGWVYAASTLIAQLGGAEIVRIDRGDLVVSSGVGPLRRTWRYRAGAIENLTSYDPTPAGRWGRNQMPRAFFLRPSTGAVKFDYGANSVYLASGVDEPEGRVIAAWLAKRLPQSASAGFR